MSGQYFLEQVATVKILKQVTEVCAECYSDINIGDRIYYDMQNYRYICSNCSEDIFKEIEKKTETIEEGSLFA